MWITQNLLKNMSKVIMYKYVDKNNSLSTYKQLKVEHGLVYILLT